MARAGILDVLTVGLMARVRKSLKIDLRSILAKFCKIKPPGVIFEDIARRLKGLKI